MKSFNYAHIIINSLKIENILIEIKSMLICTEPCQSWWNLILKLQENLENVP